MKIDFDVEFREQDGMNNIKLEIFDATHIKEANGNKLHSFRFSGYDTEFFFTVDDVILGKLFSVIALRLERND